MTSRFSAGHSSILENMSRRIRLRRRALAWALSGSYAPLVLFFRTSYESVFGLRRSTRAIARREYPFPSRMPISSRSARDTSFAFFMGTLYYECPNSLRNAHSRESLPHIPNIPNTPERVLAEKSQETRESESLTAEQIKEQVVELFELSGE